MLLKPLKSPCFNSERWRVAAPFPYKPRPLMTNVFVTAFPVLKADDVPAFCTPVHSRPSRSRQGPPLNVCGCCRKVGLPSELCSRLEATILDTA